MIRTLNIVSGLTLFLFITTHLLNLSLGIISIDVMEVSRPYFFAIWTNFPIEIVLFLALLVHPILGLRALYLRNTLRMSNQDKLQLLSSLLIIPLLIPHIVAIKAGESLLGMEATFTGFLTIMWVSLPLEGLRQVLLLIVAWVHGCIGLLTWISLKSWWKPIAAYVYPLAVAIPTFALLGFVEAGRDVVDRQAVQLKSSEQRTYYGGAYPVDSSKQTDKKALANTLPSANYQTKTVTGGKVSEEKFKQLSLAINKQEKLLIYGYLIILALVFTARYLRLRRGKEWVELHYASGEIIKAEVGPTLLEIAILNDLPHANMCHGKGRCGTCRVRILQSTSELTLADKLEQAMLDKLSSDSQTRLACQAAPSAGVVYLERLLSADLKLKSPEQEQNVDTHSATAQQKIQANL
jgi:adenylate cyclase